MPVIDVESAVYHTVYTALKTQFPSLNMDSQWVETPAKFPALNLYEASNNVLMSRSTDDSIQNGVRVMYQADIFSNAVVNRKWQVKNIFDALDDAMTNLGFTRIYTSPTFSLGESRISEMIVRYEGVVIPMDDDGYHIFQSD